MNYRDMTPEQKIRHHEICEKYRKANMDKSNEAARKYYHANKEKAKAINAAWREKNKEYIRTKQREDKRQRKLDAIQYLGGVCTDCNQQFHPAVYEFHHTDPETKDRDPSKMLQLSWAKVTAELDKCVLLCANCHRLTHHKDKY